MCRESKSRGVICLPLDIFSYKSDGCGRCIFFLHEYYSTNFGTSQILKQSKMKKFLRPEKKPGHVSHRRTNVHNTKTHALPWTVRAFCPCPEDSPVLLVSTTGEQNALKMPKNKDKKFFKKVLTAWYICDNI